jgi:hypothetical protein
MKALYYIHVMGLCWRWKIPRFDLITVVYIASSQPKEVMPSINGIINFSATKHQRMVLFGDVDGY